ncbi:pentatricopeptide repeat-containing protein 2, mitochondrial [Anoplophora glabripennis]|nr:pentatricopeptide repeat-containing protein 2, mitochondrial [Anoplophora glabripennis]
MMANRFFCILRNTNFPFCSNISNLSKANNFIAVINTRTVRHLYAKTTLGIDGFNLQREKTQHQMENIADRFKQKMIEYSQDESKSMIFTEDLKNMVHLSQNEEDVELVVKMIKKFNQQNKQLRFGNYVFGPVVMRLFYIFSKADLAYECFKSSEMTGFFDQFISYQILLDLLYENKKYDEVLEAVNLIKNRQIEGSQYPRNIIVLALAACYKINSKESLDYALKLWQELKNVGHFPMRRATTFCAGLALNQGQPGIALEILTSARNQNYTTVRNLKVVALAELGRVEDTLPILKSLLNEDIPDNNTVHTFNSDVLERVRNVIAKLENPELALEFNRIKQLLKKQGHISDMSLDEQLCLEIQQPPVMNNRQDKFSYRRINTAEQERRPNRFYTYHKRPGLEDLV